MDFKDRLGALRRAKHLNQGELAEATQVSIDTLKRWEAGKQLPRLDELIRLAAGLGVMVSALVGEESLPKESLTPIPPQPKKKKELDKIVIQMGSLKVEVPATPEGYAFVGEKLRDFKIEDIPPQEFVKSLHTE